MPHRIQILNQEIYQITKDKDLPVVVSLMGYPISEDAPGIMHKAVTGKINPEDFLISMMKLFSEYSKKGMYLYDIASMSTELELRVIIHSTDGFLIGHIIDIQDIWNLLSEVCAKYSLPQPPPLKREHHRVISLPFNPNNTKS